MRRWRPGEFKPLVQGHTAREWGWELGWGRGVESKLLNSRAHAFHCYTQKQGAQRAKKRAKPTWLGRVGCRFSLSPVSE